MRWPVAGFTSSSPARAKLDRGAAGGVLVRDAERGATAAGGDDVRVLYLEPGSHHALGVVHGRAIHVAQARGVHDHADARGVEDEVVVVLLVQRQGVLEAGATTAA